MRLSWVAIVLEALSGQRKKLRSTGQSYELLCVAYRTITTHPMMGDQDIMTRKNF